MIVTGRFAIIGDWDDSPIPNDLLPIRMPPVPNGVHGTGWHRSTQVTLNCLEAHLEPGMSFLDMGAGSGIISVAAHRLGASKVYATEIEQGALDFSGQVFKANNVQVEFCPGPELPKTDLCIGNLGVKMVKFLPTIKSDKVISVDGFGHWVVMRPTEGGYGVQYTPINEIEHLAVLTPEGADISLGRAACEIIGWRLGIPPGNIMHVTAAVKEEFEVFQIYDETFHIGDSLWPSVGLELQGIMDVQFGPGKVEISP